MNQAEAGRLAALREYRILDSLPEAAFDRITALTADLFDTPMALISLIDEHRQWFKSSVGLDGSETRREHAFCDYTIRSDEVMVVPDAGVDPRFRDNPYVLGEPYVRFYAGAPLRLANGYRLGSLCVIDSKPHRLLSESDRRRLQTLAQIVVNEMDFRLARERLELARREAEGASRAKSEFLANMSHELRTPLTSIIGFARLLGASPTLPDKEKRMAERIDVASGNLLTIVNDVLDLARLESGELAVSVEPADLAPIVAGAADLLGGQAQAKGLKLGLHLEPGLPRALIDPARLRQVLVNLISNAVKFTAKGGVEVSVRRERDELTIDVQDTGEGIPADRLAQVFDRFVQADASIARRHGGSGLGLPISRRLVEQMGGEITVESTPGEGSLFRVRIPLHAEADAASA